MQDDDHHEHRMNPDVPVLLDAICVNWQRCLPRPYGDETFMAKDGVTHCNQFVNGVAITLGYAQFVRAGETLPILANQMFDYMSAHVDEWMEVAGKIAQWHANVGVLVVAAWKHPEGDHGHVCIVRPGTLGTSGKWGSQEVPKVANVSVPELCRLDIGANYAFGAPPKYFALKAML